MKKTCILIFLISSLSYSQTKDELDLCMAIQSSNFTSNTDAENALDKILNTIGASKNFVLTPCEKINNAIATAYKGTRYILYDKEFMDLISENTNDWSNLFILAHEVGHHINGHLLDILLYMEDDIGSPTLEKKRQQELEADEFAAFVLAKLGANLSDLKSVIKIISVDKNDINSTHPNTEKRIASIEKGFKKGFVKGKTTNSNYVDFENNESFLKFGNWFREQNRSYQGDITWKSFSEAKNIKTEKSDLLDQNLILEASGKETIGGYIELPEHKIEEKIKFTLDRKQFMSIILNRFRKFVEENNSKEKKYFVGRHNTNPKLFKDLINNERKLEFSCTIEMSAKNSDGNRIKSLGKGLISSLYHNSNTYFKATYDLWDGTIKLSSDRFSISNREISFSEVFRNFDFRYFPLSNDSETKVDKIILKVFFSEIEVVNEFTISRDYLRTKSAKYDSYVSNGKKLPLNYNYEDQYVSSKSDIYAARKFMPFPKKLLLSSLKNQYSSPKTYYFEYDMRGSEKSFSNDYIEQSLIDYIKNKYYEYFE